jgi:hypothetical protein
MITYAILHVALFLVGILFVPVVGLLPGPPSWLTSATGPIANVFAGAQHLGAWFPVGIVSTVLIFLAGIWSIAFAIKLVRIVGSFFTGGGGGAG